MDKSQALEKNRVESKLNEAEAYYSMGLLSESLDVYRTILDEVPSLDSESRKMLEEKIAALQDDIENIEESDKDGLTSQDISIIREKLSDQENVTSILDTAIAFKELGLYTDACSEYEKLIVMEYPKERLAAEITLCLLKAHSPSKAFEKADKISSNKKIDEEERAQLKYWLGREMEKRGHKDYALDLYKSAKELTPKSTEINESIDSILASFSSDSKYDYLLNKKMVTTNQLQKALVHSKKRKRSVEYILVKVFKIKKDAVGKSLSFYYGCSYKNYDPKIPTPVELLSKLKKTFLLQEHWVPLSWSKDGIEVLIDDPRNLNKTDHIRALLKTNKIKLTVGIKEDIDKYINHFYEESEAAAEAEASEDASTNFEMMPDVSFEEEEEEEIEIKDDFDEASGQVVRLVDQVIITAYRKNASDIHIEPSAITKSTTIRFRIDGVCQDYINVPTSMAKGILSRVKIMAGLDIAERRLPQDGKIKFKRKGVPRFEMRVATLPTAGNFEDAVLRILANFEAMKLEDMQLSERNYKTLSSIIKKPYGLVLAVGPTGSGKTTTLHSALANINKPGVKIWTAEDPVEITQAGLRQVEIKHKIGLNFARIMRAFLRADPDIIMIGEMRDEETASIGIEASLTGHLVFSTLHTNSAPETVTRLLDMGLNPLNFSDAFLGVLAQRLVRRLCKECRTKYHPTRQEFEEIVHDYGEEQFQETGIKYNKDLFLYAPGGCQSCYGTGYSGRLAIHELMEGTPEIKSLIKQQANTDVIFESAEKQGMKTLKQDGIIKVFDGATDITEVRRVCVI